MRTQNTIGRTLSQAILLGGAGLDVCYGRHFKMDEFNNVLGCCPLGAAAFAEFGESATHSFLKDENADRNLVKLLVNRFPELKDPKYTQLLAASLKLEIEVPEMPLWVAITNISDSSGTPREDIAQALQNLGL